MHALYWKSRRQRRAIVKNSPISPPSYKGQFLSIWSTQRFSKAGVCADGSQLTYHFTSCFPTATYYEHYSMSIVFIAFLNAVYSYIKSLILKIEVVFHCFLLLKYAEGPCTCNSEYNYFLRIKVKKINKLLGHSIFLCL